MIRRRKVAIDTAQATWQIVGALLRYPDAELVAALPAIRAAAIDERIPHAQPVAELIDVWCALPVSELQARYVERFDMHRSCSLDMSWHQFGDRRQRGLVLLNLVQTYQRHGFGPASGDLPDWLRRRARQRRSRPVGRLADRD
jgi:nitrate reductase delta subunit